MNFYEGKLSAQELRIAVVIGKFNSFIGDKLLDGALNAFEQLGGDSSKLDVFKVPGSYEIPGVCTKLISQNKYNAIVCLGVIIRGQTPHFEYVASNTSKAIMELSIEGPVPVIYGLITADDMDQAIDRAGTKSGNKGYDAVLAAVEMAGLYNIISGTK
ncbi:MAG: 6,7-dimethyl-8-ribityllumazine synthase [Brevinematales bacterium]